MGVIKKKYNDHLIKNPHKEPKEPQHIIDERKVDCSLLKDDRDLYKQIPNRY